jgi:hypothetical protein
MHPGTDMLNRGVSNPLYNDSMALNTPDLPDYSEVDGAEAAAPESFYAFAELPADVDADAETGYLDLAPDTN